jgi:hypothetical protein
MRKLLIGIKTLESGLTETIRLFSIINRTFIPKDLSAWEQQ